MDNLTAVNSDDISPKRCIDYANELIELCELPFPRISSIQDINSAFFIALFERITSYKVPDLLLSDDSATDAHNIQAVIDTLSLDLLGLSLSHITGEDIVSGNIISIINLLEVLQAVFVHLPSKEEEIETRSDVPTVDGNFQISSEDEHINKAVTSVKSSHDNGENIPPASKLKRKICKNTLRKSQHEIQKKKIGQAVLKPSDSERCADITDRLKPHLKRKNSKPVVTTFKRPYIEGIEDLHELNFETKVRILLQSDESPIMRAQEMLCDILKGKAKRNKYIQSLRTPMKMRSFPHCKKSFLLPHNLRPKSKSPIRKYHPQRKISCKRQNIHTQLFENTRSSVQDKEIPAAIQSMLKEFPGFEFPENSLELLKKHYYQHISSIHKQIKNTLLKKPTTVIQNEKAVEQEAKLSKILTKDLQDKDRMREVKEHKALENRIKASLRDAKMQSIKMRQYFDEFHKSMSRKMQKRNYTEELLIEKTFKEMLDLQKEKVRLMCKRMKEADECDAIQHRKYLDALKNVYQEQLNLLAESVNAEQQESLERKKASKLANDKLNQEILKTLQKEVRSLQKDVLDMLNDIHFRELDAENFIENVHLQNSL